MKTTQEIIDKFSVALEPLGFFPMKISKFPTWINNKVQNGIEIRPNEILTFGLNMGERIYGDETEAITKKALEVFHIKEEKPKEEKPIKQEEAPQQKEQTKQVHSEAALVTVGILPDFLTSALMTKWKSMSTIDRMLMFQRTPKEEIYQIAVGKDETGKMQYAPYVKGNFMIREANAAFLFDWYLEVHEVSKSATGVSVRGKLFAMIDGKYYNRPATGYQELNKKVDAQQAEKGATTDAIKKGLSLFGFNSDVYSGEV